jgi:predicted HicB family RNase H-like nuclease
MPSAASGAGGNLTNPTFKYCSNYRIATSDYEGHWLKGGSGTAYWQWCATEAGGQNVYGLVGSSWSSSAVSTMEDCCLHNPRWGMSFYGYVTFLRCYQQGSSYGLGYLHPQAGSTFDDCAFIDAGGNSFLSYINVRNCKFINASGLGGSYNIYENIVFYNDNNNRSYLGGTRNLFRNIEIHLNSTHWNVLLSGARQCRVYNVTVYSYANAPFLSISNDVWSDNILEGLAVNGTCHVRLTGDPSYESNVSQGMQMLGRFANLSVPILSGNYGNIPGGGIVYHPVGYWDVEGLTVSSMYNRAAVHTTHPAVRFPLRARLVSSVRIYGLTVGTVQYPNALEWIGFHGWAKNRWDSDSPDHQTFDFYLNPTVAGYYGIANIGPVIAWWVFKGQSPITISGTITQLGTNEKVRVEICRYPKEPLLGDIPEFSQEFTQTGDFNITWTPPDDGVWVVRILAFLQQTTDPITIQNLSVAGAGGGGGGNVYNIQVNDGVNPTLSDSALLAASLLLTDSINPTLSEQATINAQLTLSDVVNPTLQEQLQMSVQVSLSDSISPTLQDAVNVETGTFYNISVADQLSTTLQEQVTEQAQISVSETISPTMHEQVAEQAQISISETISPTLQEQVTEQAQISINETISPTLQEQVAEQAQISVGETISPTLQEQVGVTSGGIVHIVEPLEIDISDDVLEV